MLINNKTVFFDLVTTAGPAGYFKTFDLAILKVYDYSNYLCESSNETCNF